MADFRPRAAYARFLRQQARNLPATPRPLIDETVLRMAGSAIRSLERINRSGKEVYRVTLEDGRLMALRISYDPKPHFESEQWAVARADRKGVPVSSEFLVAHRRAGKTLISFNLRDYTSGTLLNVAGSNGMSASRRSAILRDLGSHLARLHDVRTAKFGPLDGKGAGRYGSWDKFLAKLPRPASALESVARRNGLSVRCVSRSVALLGEYRPLLAAVRPKLLHGDLNADQVFVEGRRVVELIDFELCLGGDPAYDLAKWHFFNRRDFPIEELLVGYGTAPNDPDWQRRFQLSVLHHNLIHLDYYARTRDPFGMKHVVRYFEPDLETALKTLESLTT